MSTYGVNGIGSYSTANTASTTEKNSSAKAENKNTAKDTAAATYTKSEAKKVTGKPDHATIERMKADAEEKTSQLRSLVEKMMLKQGQTVNKSTDIFAMLREGKLEVDPETAAKAKEDISDNGYWGVEQTSERLVSFAKALAGNDPEQADKMIAAVEKGFKQATKAWGDELPDICKKTLDTTKEKLNDWKNSLSSEE